MISRSTGRVRPTVAASGMCDAGRIKHHLRNNLPRSNATVLFVGYQSPGTLGQIILSGARTVSIHGEQVPVRARIRSLGNYSAHADHTELMHWITGRLPAHGAIFLTHGEDEERTALRKALLDTGIAGDQVILPLLDGLDEVASDRRVAAANADNRIAGHLDHCRPLSARPLDGCGTRRYSRRSRSGNFSIA